jgi:nucleoside-diphosphate-sugar epimerase
MKTALITGGAGFIGSHLTKTLLEDGYRVRVLDNFSTGCKDNLQECIRDIELIQGDIRDSEVVERSIEKVNIIFHLAAQISVAESMKDPAACFDVNVTGTNLILDQAARGGVEKVIISSSAAVYGNQDLFPIQEISNLKPLSPYAASKQMDEIMASMYTRAYHLPVICLRYFNVFGERQDPNSPYAAAIPIFISRMLSNNPPILYGDGGQTRDFIYISDVVRANILAAKNGPPEGAILNICTGKQVSILELIDDLQKIIPGSPPLQKQPARGGDIYHSYGSPKLAKKIISFEAEVKFSEGLKRTIEWMKQ